MTQKIIASDEMALQTFHATQPKERGSYYEDFEVGKKFDHHWGRTITASDNSVFSTITLHFNPIYFNDEYAQAHHKKGIVVNPYLVFSIVFGLSVEDLSEKGGAFLGVENLHFKRDVYVGETLRARSEVVSMRLSSREQFGIVTWKTLGLDEKNEVVVNFERTNMVLRRDV